MLRKIGIGVVLILLVLIVAACAGPTPAPTPEPTPTPAPNPTPAPPSQTPNPTLPPSWPVKATWIEPQLDGNTVSIPVSEVEDNWNIHFELETEVGNINFMAYIVDGEIYVRSNVCPPCRSVGFSLNKDILVCDRCATIFEVKTGEGIEGACVDYPKAAVSYEITGANIVMSGTDLIAAFQDTLNPGWP